MIRSNKTASVDPMKVIVGMVLVIAVAFLLFYTYNRVNSKAISGINYVFLELEIRHCAAKNNQLNIPGLGEVIIRDIDNDDFPDSCDICLGTGIILIGGGHDGDNGRDSDQDFYPDSCDSNPGNPEEHECIFQLCELNEGGECEEFRNQCCTPTYVSYIAERMEESGTGARTYSCEPVNSQTLLTDIPSTA